MSGCLWHLSQPLARPESDDDNRSTRQRFLPRKTCSRRRIDRPDRQPVNSDFPCGAAIAPKPVERMGLAGRAVAELLHFGPSQSAQADCEPRASALLNGSHLGPRGSKSHATRPSVEWQSVLCIATALNQPPQEFKS